MWLKLLTQQFSSHYTHSTRSYIPSIPLLMCVLLLGIFSCCLVLFAIIIIIICPKCPTQNPTFQIRCDSHLPSGKFSHKLVTCVHTYETNKKKSHTDKKNLTLFSKTISVCLGSLILQLALTQTHTVCIVPC